jgi:hypothetical protein
MELIINKIGQVRRKTFEGRRFLVADMTILRPQVLNGSQGALYYPPDQVSANPGVWNHTPLVIYHPTDANGNNITARSPETLERVKVGYVFNDNWDGEKRTAEAWFDEEKLIRVENALKSDKPGYVPVYPRLLSNEPIELSTGLFTDNYIATNGAQAFGKAYSHIAKNYRPDHLAILPDQKGACSVKDGCGVNNSEVEIETIKPDPTLLQKIKDSISSLIPALNAFCPTGKGGGQDNSCSSKAEGAGDAKRGLPITENPYKVGTAEHKSYQEGHLEQQGKGHVPGSGIPGGPTKDTKGSGKSSGKVKVKEIHSAIAQAAKEGKSVTVKTGNFTYKNVKALSKGGGRFMGYDSETGKPHKFHGLHVVDVTANAEEYLIELAPEESEPVNNEETEVNRDQVIQYLTTNCECYKGKDKILANKDLFTDEELNKLKDQTQAFIANQLVVNALHEVAGEEDLDVNEMPAFIKAKMAKGKKPACAADEEEPEVPTGNTDFNDFLKLPPEKRLTVNEREALNFAESLKNEAKKRYIDRLVENNAKTDAGRKAIRPAFEAMTLNQLKTMVKELPSPAERVQTPTANQEEMDTILDFVGASGGIVNNHRGEPEVDPDDVLSPY